MAYKYVTAEVEVNLSEFDTEDLIDELESRGLDYNTKHVDGEEMRQVLESIYEKRKLNKDYQRDLDDLIWGVLGKM
jgi:uncharacterized protein YpuA (DUF1002 family)